MFFNLARDTTGSLDNRILGYSKIHKYITDNKKSKYGYIFRTQGSIYFSKDILDFLPTYESNERLFTYYGKTKKFNYLNNRGYPVNNQNVNNSFELMERV